MKTLIYTLAILFTPILVLGQVAQFTDISVDATLNLVGINSGIAFGDYDNDGLDDIYVSVLVGDNKLYHNEGNGTFVEVTNSAGVTYSEKSNCSVWGDINNDGWLDLYVTGYNLPNKMFLNNGDGTFSDITSTAGVNNTGRARSVMFADIDNDGDIDLYVANLLDPNVMYRNNGDNTFTNITAASNTGDNKIAMGSIFFDYDNDGDQDLYLTHDAYQPYIMLENNGSGVFTDISAATGLNYAGQGMGVDIGDYNNDGHFDVYITNLGYNNMFKNNGDGTFTDKAQELGVPDVGMGWGTFFLDFDNDGLVDVYVINDSFFAPNENVLYKNMDMDTFHIVSNNTPLTSFFSALGGGSSDINNDGLVDIMVAIMHGNGNQLFRNDYAGNNHYIKVKTEGTTSNRAGIGTRIEVFADGKMQTQAVTAGRGYCSANSLTMHYGVGQATQVDSMILYWSSGQVDKHYNIQADKYYNAIEGGTLSEMIVTTSTLNYDIPKIEIQTSPNPFTDEVRFDLNLTEGEEIVLNIFDAQGKLVYQTQKQLVSGQQQVIWNGKDTKGGALPTGQYFYQLVTEKQFSSGKLIKL